MAHNFLLAHHYHPNLNLNLMKKTVNLYFGLRKKSGCNSISRFIKKFGIYRKIIKVMNIWLQFEKLLLTWFMNLICNRFKLTLYKKKLHKNYFPFTRWLVFDFFLIFWKIKKKKPKELRIIDRNLFFNLIFIVV